jgi:hypothetical protein
MLAFPHAKGAGETEKAEKALALISEAVFSDVEK